MNFNYESSISEERKEPPTAKQSGAFGFIKKTIERKGHQMASVSPLNLNPNGRSQEHNDDEIDFDSSPKYEINYDSNSFQSSPLP